MGRKEQWERERKKAAKGSHALSGFGFLPKKRSWSDGDLNATVTSQWQHVEEDSSSWSSRQLQEQDEESSLQSSSSTQVSFKLIVFFVPAGPQNVSLVLNGLAGLRATAKLNFKLPQFVRLHLSILSFYSRAFWTVSRLLSAELVLVVFFAAVPPPPPLWKRMSVCTWYKKTFLGGFFLVGSTFSGYVL